MSGKKSRQQLFSCVLDDPNPSGERIESEEELVDKVLKEGLKLKNKCKLLTKQCNDYEIRLINTSNAYELSLRQKEQQLQEAHAHFEELSSRLNTSHSRDLQMIKDSKDNEIRELKIRIVQLQENVSKIPCGFDIESIQKTNEKNEKLISYLQSELEQVKIKAENSKLENERMRVEIDMLTVEKTDIARDSQKEICTLRITIEDLLSSKNAVVSSVNHVMEDNKNLREKLNKILHKDSKANSPTFSSIFFTKNSNSPGK